MKKNIAQNVGKKLLEILLDVQNISHSTSFYINFRIKIGATIILVIVRINSYHFTLITKT